jgi:hypothetical protein
MLIIRSILKLVHFVPNTDPWQKNVTGSGYLLPGTGTVPHGVLNILYLSFTESLQRLLNLSNFSDFDRKVPVGYT